MHGQRQQADDPRLEEAALLACVAARDGHAFRVLINRHGAMLHRIAARITGDGHEAEDIAQEALLRLWDHAPRWQPGGMNVAAWLTRVAVNLAIDRQRRTKRLAGDAMPERVDEAPLADAALAQSEAATAARALIAALPDRQRAAIVLTYYEELPNQAAAEVLGMNLKAFESLLFRARAALKAGFVEQGGAP